ncbi:hypothetical protein F442_19213 [Phytophthora nicotianae P10297]|uniref:Uncharacterized protein n=3 Tax=Phytophthora nicotianae TaxID=4792 RepID=W2YAB7_PHYNI|nr:hypothetical protein L916_18758 [Phytophthora nicotianae]ETO62760.1 hypothetical protein F444_19395 [Phytophthora nicotianae P1976]ETP32005.1 hypothetical protein F442_19213 [Phytophthora nicotianae P10297]
MGRHARVPRHARLHHKHLTLGLIHCSEADDQVVTNDATLQWWQPKSSIRGCSAACGDNPSSMCYLDQVDIWWHMARLSTTRTLLTKHSLDGKPSVGQLSSGRKPPLLASKYYEKREVIAASLRLLLHFCKLCTSVERSRALVVWVRCIINQNSNYDNASYNL